MLDQLSSETPLKTPFVSQVIARRAKSSTLEMVAALLSDPVIVNVPVGSSTFKKSFDRLPPRRMTSP